MAVEAVVALMLNKLDKLVVRDTLLRGMHGEIKRIRKGLNEMRPFLKDADIKQKEDEAVRDWMEDIRDICFDVDDVIDILGQDQAASGRHEFVKRLITRYKVGKEIKRLKLNIQDVTKSGISSGIIKINEERAEATSSTQHLKEGSGCPDPPQLTTVVSTLPGDSEEVDLQEETNPAGQQLMEEEPRPRDGTSSSTPGLQADRPFSTPLQAPEEVGLQEEIDTVGKQLIEEETRPHDGTRDIDEGKLLSYQHTTQYGGGGNNPQVQGNISAGTGGNISLGHQGYGGANVNSGTQGYGGGNVNLGNQVSGGGNINMGTQGYSGGNVNSGTQGYGGGAWAQK